MSVKNRKKRILPIAGGGIILLVLCLFFILSMVGSTKQIRSDSAGVEFITDGEIITCVNIKGQFPYLSVVPKLAEYSKTDSEGNIAEIYTIEAEISLNTRNSMKLFIETSEEVTYTYILKFADKDITISNGKVLE